MMIVGLVLGFLGAALMGIAAFQFVTLEQEELKTFPEKLPLGDRQQDSAIRNLEKVVQDMMNLSH